MTRACCSCACFRQLSCSPKQRYNFDMEHRHQYRALQAAFGVFESKVNNPIICSRWQKQKNNCVKCFSNKQFANRAQTLNDSSLIQCQLNFVSFTNHFPPHSLLMLQWILVQAQCAHKDIKIRLTFLLKNLCWSWICLGLITTGWGSLCHLISVDEHKTYLPSGFFWFVCFLKCEI